MKEINNLTYRLEIENLKNSEIETSITVEFNENGLKTKRIQAGDVCITEEMIGGRILGARLDSPDGYCGYKYDYQNNGVLLNLNPYGPDEEAASLAAHLIRERQKNLDFQQADLVLSSILRNDYQVVILKEGDLKVTKTVSAENEKRENCCLQEIVNLSKSDGENSFVENHKTTVYKVNEDEVIETQTPIDSEIKSELKALSYIMSQHPQSCKDLAKIKEQIPESPAGNMADNEKCYE
jgi:hypothetical protein